MEVQSHFFLHKLRGEFSARQRTNPRYSLRSFAKDLNIDSSNLSAILKQKRGLPTHRAEEIAKLLRLSPKEAALFIGSTYKKKMSLDHIQVQDTAKKLLLDEAYFQIIAEWEHYAFLQLLALTDFRSDIEWISQRLNITDARAEAVIENLLRLKMIVRDEHGNFKRCVQPLETSEDIASRALHESHLDTLKIAKNKLNSVEVAKRDFSAVTFGIDSNKLPEFKALIREFQDKLDALAAGQDADEVYILNCQLFPVTHKEKKK